MIVYMRARHSLAAELAQQAMLRNKTHEMQKQGNRMVYGSRSLHNRLSTILAHQLISSLSDSEALSSSASFPPPKMLSIIPKMIPPAVRKIAPRSCTACTQVHVNEGCDLVSSDSNHCPF